MKTLKVGIATLDQYKARTMAIARGEYVPAAGERHRRPVYGHPY